MKTKALLGACAASLLLAAGPALAQDFEAVNEYMDKMYSSDACAKFTAKVGGSRKVVGINMYRRVASWGD